MYEISYSYNWSKEKVADSRPLRLYSYRYCQIETNDVSCNLAGRNEMFDEVSKRQ